MNQREFYILAHSCPCGSGLVSSWRKDEKGKDTKSCEKCAPKILYRIFERKYLESGESRGDILVGLGCGLVADVESAKRARNLDQILIPCPGGGAYLLVPKDCAEMALKEGQI